MPPEREAVTKPGKIVRYICRRFNDCCDEDKDALLLDLAGRGVDLAPGPVADDVPLAHAQRGVALVVQEHLGAVCRGGAGVDCRFAACPGRSASRSACGRVYGVVRRIVAASSVRPGALGVSGIRRL